MVEAVFLDPSYFVALLGRYYNLLPCKVKSLRPRTFEPIETAPDAKQLLSIGLIDPRNQKMVGIIYVQPPTIRAVDFVAYTTRYVAVLEKIAEELKLTFPHFSTSVNDAMEEEL